MKTKLVFFIFISLFMGSCSTQRNLSKNSKVENDCVVPQEQTLKYKFQKKYSQMRYNSKMKPKKTFAKQNRTKHSIQDVNNPFLIEKDIPGMNDLHAGLNNPQKIRIELQEELELSDSQQKREISKSNIPPLSPETIKINPNTDLRDNTVIPSSNASFTALAPTFQEDESMISSLPSKNLVTKKRERRRGNRLLYLAGALIGILTSGTILGFRKKVTTYTRWSKANPVKAQVLIAGLQTLLMGLAIYSGHNLRELGIEISDTPSYIFGGLMAAGFLTTPFLVRRDNIAIPKQVNLQRLKFLGIIISSLMVLTTFGNNVVANHPDSKAAMILTSMDQTITQAQGDITIDDKKPDPKKYRWGVLILGVLAIIALTISLCAGICIALLVGSVGGFFGGIAIAGLAIAGMVFSSKWVQRRFKIKT